jgi:hypothetical protein
MSCRRALAAAVALAALAAACHTDPFAAGAYGATGPYRTVQGEGQLTTGGGSLLDYTPDGSGIAIAEGLCAYRLPAAGGSAVWTYCIPNVGPNPVVGLDSAVRIPAEALSSRNRLVFSRMAGPVSKGTPWPYPAEYNDKLWIRDSSGLREVLQLYRDSIGHALVPPDSINWVSNAEWIDDSDLFVVAANLSPAAVITQFGIAHGIVNSQPFTLTLVPGTATARLYAPFDQGREVIFADTGLVLWTVPTDGGPVSPAGTVPVASHRAILGLSCTATDCAILTAQNSTGPTGNVTRTSTLWHFDPGTGSLVEIREFFPYPYPVPSGLTLSPADGDVAFQQGGQVYLLPAGS